ncbi:MAG TPA: alpha/beta hydrolase [Stellaceae bacterium]|jgi:pimeloyl-ACP methyl ester carboxylesterase|nr:alpha/beta hydrolase [Stellaceae bacterium]
MPDPIYSTITLRGATVPMKRAGTGQTMLVLHGAGGSPRFLPAMRALSEQFAVIVPQAPGFGGVAAPPWLETMADLGNFYLDFMDEFDLRNVHLVGLSLGGWAAAELAVRNTSRLASLTLMDAPGIEVAGTPYRDPTLLSEEQAVRETYFDPKMADDAIARTFNPANEAVRLANRSMVARLTAPHRFHDPQMQRWLHRIRIPTLIVWGENDRNFPPVYGEAWHQAIAGSRLVVVPRCGHLPIQEQPEAFAAAVGEFCGKVDATAG